MKFFNPYADIRKTKHHLPHWQQPGACYFLTWRMADSLPQELLATWRDEREAWLALHPSPLSAEDEMEYHQRFSSRIDEWLDAGHGSCVLKRSDLRAVVQGALEHFQGERYDLLSYVIMPNHVHACAVLHPQWALEKVLHSWKRFSAREIQTALGTEGKFWMHDYFDRLIRDERHFGNVLRYIHRNPEKAGLCEGEFTLWESEVVRTRNGTL